MKTKNVKVRADDVKNGVVMYTAHPKFGIDIYHVTGKPFLTANGSWFFPAKKVWEDSTFTYHDTFSLVDCGIGGVDDRQALTAGYNGRRTFFKKKHAIEWMNKWKNDPSFISHYEEHLRNMREWADMNDEMWDRDCEIDGRIHLTE